MKKKNNLKTYTTWQDFTVAVNILADVISQEEVSIDVIYGVPRGGLCIGTSLSHKLNIPLIVKEKQIKKHTNVLVVDDISDSGMTLSKIKAKYSQNLMFATWHYSSTNSMFEPDFWVTDNEGQWVVYPWEWG